MTDPTIIFPPTPLPTQVMLFAGNTRIVTGGRLEMWANSSIAWYSEWNPTSPIDGYELAFEVPLQAGTYTVQTWGRKLNDSGILDWRLDSQAAAAFLTVDTYAATSTPYGNYGYGPYGLSGSASVNITFSGMHTLYAKVNGKHASSSGYIFRLTGVSLHKTA